MENNKQSQVEISSDNNSTVDDYGKFHINDIFEMCSILKDLCKKPEVITAFYDNQQNEFILTSILSVDVKNKSFLLEGSTEQQRNLAVTNSKKLICKAKQNNVRVEFSITKFKLIRHDDEDAFICHMPDNILYLQRREFYRSNIPLGDKLKCRLNLGAGESYLLDIFDISCGGIGLIDAKINNNYALFDIYHSCEIDFGEIGSITFDIEVRNIFNTTTDTKKDAIKLGFAFIDATSNASALIQRYILSVDLRKKQSK